MSDIRQPLVSVLVPIYNVETYLEQCLSSLASQTLDNIEVLCINDGSTDSSPAIIQSFLDRDRRFRLVDKSNSGYGDSMNKGLDVARGKYVAILESDDFMEPDGLAYMVEQAERASLEVFKCNFWLYWSKATEDHSFRHDLYFPLASPEMVEMGPHAPVDYPEVFWSKASIWSALYLRSFLEENHIRFPVPPTRTPASPSRCLPAQGASPTLAAPSFTTVKTTRSPRSTPRARSSAPAMSMPRCVASLTRTAPTSRRPSTPFAHT